MRLIPAQSPFKTPVVPATEPIITLQITEDADHYYVTIDREQRDRAKSIPGRVWNPEIRKWVYPRTSEVYRALRREFGGQPEKLRITAPNNGASASQTPSATSQTAAPTAPATKYPPPPPPVPLAAPGEKLDALESLLREQLRLSIRIQERLTYLEGAVAAVASGQMANSPANGHGDIRSILEEFETRLSTLLPDSQTEIGGPKRAQEDQVSDWLMTQIMRGTNDDRTIVDVCTHWHLVNDYRSVVDDLEEKLKARLRDILDLAPDSKKSLHELINDGFENGAINREQSKLLGAFRVHRNALAHESRDFKPRKLLRFLHAISALALVWPELGKAPPPDRDDDEETSSHRDVPTEPSVSSPASPLRKQEFSTRESRAGREAQEDANYNENSA